MAIVPMQKVAILAHHSLREQLIERLHEEGVVEISELPQRADVDHTEVNFRKAELHYAIHTLTQAASKDILTLARRPASTDDILRAAMHTDVRGIVDRLHQLATLEAEAQQAVQECIQRIHVLQPWTTLPDALNAPAASRTTVRILGTIPLAQVQTLREAVAHHAPRSHIDLLGHTAQTASAVALVYRSEERLFEEAATAHGWTTVLLPAWAGTPATLYTDAVQQLGAAERVRDAVREERGTLALELPALTNVERFMHWLDAKQSVREAMGSTQRTIAIFGWIPKKCIVRLERQLQRISPAVAILRVKPEEDEEAPVLLKHLPFIAPFVSVTGLYGLPRPTDLDPTPALSPFFILFFALCLTDAGYGLALVLIFGITLWKLKKSVTEAPLLWLLFLSGIVSVLVGVLFGGYFGLTPAQVPAALTTMTADGELWFKGQFWNLSQQSGISFLQNLALVLGLTHLFLGMFLAGFHKWVHGQRAAAFWQDFTSHILLGAVLFRIAAPTGLREIAPYVLYGAIALAVWGKGHGTRWFLRPVFGVLGMLNFCIGLLSNGLSYLRLLALGLVTGAMAMAVNQVAVEMGKLFPTWLAIPVIVVIFLGGHLVSIALNTLGSFIHAGRLQFIEFFSQFFEGGGRPFAPFRRSST